LFECKRFQDLLSPFSYAQKENGLQAYDIITHETKDISKATITNLSCSKKESLVAFTSELGALTRVYVYDEETQSMTIAYELPSTLVLCKISGGLPQMERPCT